MKIPTTPPGGAPYYHGPPVNGMEMNPQWQGNGVVIDGGAPGNGAAYLLPHPVHPAGFAPPAGYYGPGVSPPAPAAGPAVPQDFSEYMWMENEEEFDKQVMQQLEEEALMEQCIEAMLADEREAQNRGSSDASLEEQVSKSTLNPLAAEFVPTFAPSALPVAGPSDLDVQSSAPALSANTSKSVESSMSELSISQTSDAPTESSKSSTGEIPEELCNLPLDATTIRQEPDKEEIDTKIIKNEPVIAVCVIPDKSEKIDSAKSAPKEETTKKPTEAKSKVESAKVQSKQNQESKDSKPVPKSDSTVSHKGTKTQDSKPDVVAKKNETNISKTNQSKNVTSGNAKGKAPEVKAKETEKPKPSVEIVTEPTISGAPVTPEAEKPPSAPAVFNYAAAARANLPAKPSQPTIAQTTTPVVSAQQPIVKQDSVSKEVPTSTSVNQNSTSKPQVKPGPKQIKPNRDSKDSKGPTATRGGAAGPRKNKK
ncbi:uncharacterized protein LOC143909665 [Arctopsyche grandis]|uniref:uncharacterized protein LOC143909665 n=1 Tax=Arctopsyche grandis TaxID=121162 RepID=UPI00406D68D6